MPQPPVTIILPVFNEVETIDRTLTSLVGQDYEGALDLIVADGGSTDGTREKLERWADTTPNVIVIDNDRRGQSYGLNAAAEASDAPFLVRSDGHTHYAPDYVRQSVNTVIETGAAAGGRMNPVGTNPFGRAVAAAMNSRLTMGPARFHHANRREVVDTVYLGAFPREDFLDLGGFRAFPSGAAEDADFYHRWNRTGRTVVVDPVIHSEYTPRQDPGALWSQYYRYGLGKSEMLWINGRLPSSRPLAPAILVVGLTSTGVAGMITKKWWPFFLALASWLTVVGTVAIRSRESMVRVMAAAMIMHTSYGFGVLQGLARGPGPVAYLKEEQSEQRR